MVVQSPSATMPGFSTPTVASPFITPPSTHPGMALTSSHHGAFATVPHQPPVRAVSLTFSSAAAAAASISSPHGPMRAVTHTFAPSLLHSMHSHGHHGAVPIVDVARIAFEGQLSTVLTDPDARQIWMDAGPTVSLLLCSFRAGWTHPAMSTLHVDLGITEFFPKQGVVVSLPGCQLLDR